MRIKPLSEGMHSPVLVQVKRVLHVYPVDGEFTPELSARVRGRQREWGWPEDGIIDEPFLKKVFVDKIK